MSGFDRQQRRANHGLDAASGLAIPGKATRTQDLPHVQPGASARNAIALAHGAATRVDGWTAELASSMTSRNFAESGRLAFEIRSALRRAERLLAEIDPASAVDLADDIAAAKARLAAVRAAAEPLLVAAPRNDRPGSASPAAEAAWTGKPAWADDVADLAPRLGLGAVDVKSDDTSRRVTDAEGARGVAVGNVVHLNPDRVEPGTPEGREVLAHELVHVAQSELGAEHDDDARGDAEAEAEALATALTTGGPVHAPTQRLDLSRPAADNHGRRKTKGLRLSKAEQLADTKIVVAAMLAEHALERLEKHGDREPIIAELSKDMTECLAPAIATISTVEPERAATIFGPQIEQLGFAVAMVRRFLERPGAGDLVPVFIGVVRSTNRLRKHIGLDLLGKIPLPISANEVAQVKSEERELDSAANEFRDAIAARFAALGDGADTFNKLVEYTPPPEPPPMWESIVTGVLLAVVGNLLGPAAGGIGLLSKLSDTIKGQDAIKGIVSGIVNDSFQAVGGVIAGVVSDARGESYRDQQAITNAIKGTQNLLQLNTKDQISERLRRNNITAAELTQWTAELSAHNNQANDRERDRVYREASLGFAKILALGSVGASKDGDGDQVSKLDGYFDLKGSSITNIRSKQGSAGVGKLWVNVRTGGRLEFGSFAVHGMNELIAQAIFEHAERRLDKLDLPVEIHFNVGEVLAADGHHFMAGERPKLVLDEKGTIRAKHEWDVFDDLLSGSHRSLASPEAVVAALRGQTAPSSMPFRSAK